MLEQDNKHMNDGLAWPFAILIVALLVVTEALPIFGTGPSSKWDWSFTYVTMRFVLLPAACIAHAGMNLFRIIQSRKKKPQIKQFSSIIVSLGYLISLYFYTLPLMK